VRSALRRQPASPDVRETNPNRSRKARHWRAFAIWRKVSGLPNMQDVRPIPATTANIPVFGRQPAETEFDYHCAGQAAVAFSVFSARRSRCLRIPLLDCQAAAGQHLFQPCIPMRATKVPAGPDWLHEIRHDGICRPLAGFRDVCANSQSLTGASNNLL